VSGVLPQLGLVVVLVLVNAAFAGTELALVSLREGQLQRLEQRSATGRVLADLARRPNQFLATIQIGITLAGFLASAAAAVSLAEPLVEPLGFLGDAAEPVSVIVVTLILAYFTLVFGELAPKRVAMQRAERWGMVMARPLATLSKLTRPVVWLLSKSTDIAVRLMGADPSRQREQVTEAELREMVAAQPTFTAEQRLIIDGAFEFAERTLDEVLVPRRSVFVIDSEHTCARALDELVESGHSRAPVAAGRNLDNVTGIVHMRQLIAGGDTSATDVAVEAAVFYETANVLKTLRELQARRVQMALVANEHGGIEGIVTVEDLIEELVGEIYDETDPDRATITHNGDGTITVPGSFPIHDLDQVGIEAPAGEFSTVAGLVLDRLGRIPDRPGDSIEIDGWRIDVLGIHRRAITEVRFHPTTSHRQHSVADDRDGSTTAIRDGEPDSG
jgi:putative hemolysin